ncbi:hypothetical protein [Halomonas mongoliensis]|uniref:hypothetical protein n=1 Tax=Halomonas mongoliensis TaxID=321265 RepID=UPI00403A9985
MATGKYIVGNWSDTQQKLGAVAVGVICAVLADLLYGNGFIPSALAFIAYFMAAVTLTVACAWSLLPRAFREDPNYDTSSIMPLVLIALGIMWLFSWKWIAIAGFVMAFINSESGGARRFRDWGWYYIGALSFVVLIQMWLNTAAINTMGSDETLLDNQRIESLAPMLAALGFAVFMMRLVPARGTQVIAVFIMSAMGFYHAQTQVVEWWAERQSDEDQRSAIFASFGKIALLNQAPSLIIREENANPNRIRLYASFLPAATVLNQREEEMKAVLDSADAGTVLASMQEAMLQGGQAQREGKRALQRAHAGYEAYMTAYMLRLDDEQTAHNLAYHHAPALLQDRDTPLTRRELARHIIREINNEVPARRRNLNGYRAIYNSHRGRDRVMSGLREIGVNLPRDWEFTDFEAFRRDIESGLLSKARRLERSVSRHLSTSPESLASLQVNGTPFMSWDDYTLKGLGLSLPQSTRPSSQYTPAQYRADVQHVFDESRARSLLELALPSLQQGQARTLPIKAAILPSVVIVTSFLVLIFNLAALIYALYERYGWRLLPYLPSWLRKRPSRYGKILIGWGIFVFVLSFGPTNLYLSAQEKTYGIANGIFRTLSIPATFSDRDAEYREAQAQHHLDRAARGVRGNWNLNFTFETAKFHLEMASYYSRRTTPEIREQAELILRRYRALGADKLNSPHFPQFQQDRNYLSIRFGIR